MVEVSRRLFSHFCHVPAGTKTMLDLCTDSACNKREKSLSTPVFKRVASIFSLRPALLTLFE